MEKIKTKYVVDLVLLVSFLLTAVTGVLIFFFLPPSEGRGIHSELLGWGRHDWGAVHNWAGIIMMLATVLHVVFNWNVFIAMTKKFFGNKDVNNK
ncbi:MAG TPA: DUF4405 domain-containing protein [Candidatus Moranbacteria bacterium]|nr:DUF4405 domain-containing protein [Candidatus Moranbacteria bacterium]